MGVTSLAGSKVGRESSISLRTADAHVDSSFLSDASDTALVKKPEP